MKTRTVIDQELCRKVQIMLKGAKANEVAKLLGIGATTVSRIKAAGFNSVQYNLNTDQRRMKDKDKATDRKIDELEKQLPGQMKMEMPAEEEKPEMSEQTKMMRFQAHQADRIMMMQKRIIDKLDRLNDTMSQILRCVGSERT